MIAPIRRQWRARQGARVASSMKDNTAPSLPKQRSKEQRRSDGLHRSADVSDSEHKSGPRRTHINPNA
jgi:hypothetical protein